MRRDATTLPLERSVASALEHLRGDDLEHRRHVFGCIVRKPRREAAQLLLNARQWQRCVERSLRWRRRRWCRQARRRVGHRRRVQCRLPFSSRSEGVTVDPQRLRPEQPALGEGLVAHELRELSVAAHCLSDLARRDTPAVPLERSVASALEHLRGDDLEHRRHVFGCIVRKPRREAAQLLLNACHRKEDWRRACNVQHGR